MKKLLEISLGITTSVGGFLEIGSIATAAQAGALYGYQLLWAVALGGICVIVLVEQSGRLAAISRHTVVDAIRERFGFRYFFFFFLILGMVTLLVLGAEMGGVCVALEMATGIAFRWWAIPLGLLMWLLIWKGTFSFIEQGVSLLGLITLCFVIGAVMMHPDWKGVVHGFLPTTPGHEKSRYWFIAASILGASISPYLFFFYSSGAIEDEWDESYIGINRIIASMGMSFGTLISISVLILAALVFPPRMIQVDHYSQLALLLLDVFGRWGFTLFVLSLGIACLGAALEITLEMTYMLAQGFGWNWSKNEQPIKAARFSLAYTIVIVLGALIVTAGIDPLKLTVFSMALTAATLPISIVPFLFLMNDKHYVEDHRNGWFSNLAVGLIIGLAFVLAIVSIPLEIIGGD